MYIKFNQTGEALGETFKLNEIRYETQGLRLIAAGVATAVTDEEFAEQQWAVNNPEASMAAGGAGVSEEYVIEIIGNTLVPASSKGIISSNSVNQTTALQSFINTYKRVLIDVAEIKITGTIDIPSGSHIEGLGAGKTTLIATTWTSGATEPVFKSNGASNITVRNLSVTGNTAEKLAFFRVNPFPGGGENLLFENLQIYDFWGSGLDFGFKDNETSSMTKNVRVNNLSVRNLTDPNNFYIAEGDVTHQCRGIDLGNGVKKIQITNLFADSCSGSAIFGFGTGSNNPAIVVTDPEWENLIINGFIIQKTFMGIELNGSTEPGYKSVISNGVIMYPNRKGGYAMSVANGQSTVTNVSLITTENSALEIFGNKTLLNGVNIVMSVFKTASGGRDIPSPETNNAGIEIYGSSVKMTNCKIYFDPVFDNASLTTQKFSGVKIIGGNPYAMPIEGFAEDQGHHIEISNCLIEGVNEAFVSATNDPVEDVYIHGNTFRSKYITESAIWIQGLRWLIEDNIFDMVGGTSTTTELVIRHNQATDTKSYLFGNTILVSNDSWTLTTLTDRYTHYNNTYVKDGVSWVVNTVPRVTQTQRLAMSGLRLGMRVFQTDNTVGTWRYEASGWELDLPSVFPAFTTSGGITMPNNNGIYMRNSSAAAKAAVLSTSGNKLQLYSIGSGIEFWAVDGTASYANMTNAGLWNFGANAAPHSSMTINGSFATAYVAKTAAYTLTVSDHTVNFTIGTVNATLPSASGIAGRQYVIMNSGTGVITVVGTINGATNYTLAAASGSVYKFVTVMSTGSNWIIIANN